VTYPYPGQPPVPGVPQGYAPQQPAPVGYPQPPQPQYVPQQPAYAPQGPPQQPQPELAQGSLDAFFSQPSVGGGAALKFEVNTAHVGVVARPLSHGDVQQQTNPQNGQPAYYKDGRPKFVMKVPLRVPVSQTNTDGQAQWYVAGQARDELLRAQLESGAPEGPPEAGAVIHVACTGTRPSGPGLNPSKTYAVRYWRPGDPQGAQFAQQCGISLDGIATSPAPAAASATPAPQVETPAAPVAPVPQVPQPPAPPAPVAPPAPAAPAAQAPVAQPPAPPVANGNTPLTAEQQALLASLAGTQAPTG
jgi:hypothetical protein